MNESDRLREYEVAHFSNGVILVQRLREDMGCDPIVEFKPSKIQGLSETKWFTDDIGERKLAKLAISEYVGYEPEIKC